MVGTTSSTTIAPAHTLIGAAALWINLNTSSVVNFLAFCGSPSFEKQNNRASDNRLLNLHKGPCMLDGTMCMSAPCSGVAHMSTSHRRRGRAALLALVALRGRIACASLLSVLARISSLSHFPPTFWSPAKTMSGSPARSQVVRGKVGWALYLFISLSFLFSAHRLRCEYATASHGGKGPGRQTRLDNAHEQQGNRI